MSLDICIMLYAMEPGKRGGIAIPAVTNLDSDIATTTETGLRSGSSSSTSW